MAVYNVVRVAVKKRASDNKVVVDYKFGLYRSAKSSTEVEQTVMEELLRACPCEAGWHSHKVKAIEYSRELLLDLVTDARSADDVGDLPFPKSPS